jgi:hypothetical protein
MENGKTIINLKRLEELAALYNVKVVDILSSEV